MNALLVSLPTGALLSGLLLFGTQAHATGPVDSMKVRGGTLACGGNHFSRMAGSEQHRTTYVLRNFSDNATITIERFLVFDANANVLFDFPGFAFPVSAKTELGPQETTQINSADILFEDLGSAARPIQAHIDWSYVQGQKDIALNGSTVRTVRVTDNGAELSRASSECRLIDLLR